MEIGTSIQGAGQIGVNAQQSNALQVSEKTEVADSSQIVQKDFQVDIKDELKNKLADFAKMLQNREKLMQSLPEEIRKAVAEILEGMLPEAELPQGLASLLKGQKNMAEQLKNMGTILDLAAVLNKDEHSEIKAFLSKVLENFATQAKATPQQLSAELLQFVKQLPASATIPQGNFKQAAEQLLQQALPESMQPFGSAEQKSMIQLTNLLGKDMPVQLGQLAQQNNLTELPGVWAALKAAEAWQFKDLQSTTLQAAADSVQQLIQEMTSEKGTMAGEMQQTAENLPIEDGSEAKVLAKLGELSKTLPPEIRMALEQTLKQGNVLESLGVLADRFRNAALLNEHMSGDLQSFIQQTVESLAAKFTSLPAEASHILTQLVQQLSDADVTTEQLKTFMQQLKTQLFTGDPQSLEKQQHVWDELTQLFEQNVPQALQEGAVKHKLPEVPKLWVLLNSLGAEQWQHLDAENLQKSAGVVKELAQSIYKSTGLTGEKQAEQSTLSFSVPLHVAEGVYYPAHIHIYHQQKNNGNLLAEREFETWLRISVDTENIGMVESVFRLYGDNKLCVRVNFPDSFAADQFSQDLPKIRTGIRDANLSVTDIMVNKI